MGAMLWRRLCWGKAMFLRLGSGLTGCVTCTGGETQPKRSSLTGRKLRRNDPADDAVGQWARKPKLNRIRLGPIGRD